MSFQACSDENMLSHLLVSVLGINPASGSELEEWEGAAIENISIKVTGKDKY